MKKFLSLAVLCASVIAAPLAAKADPVAVGAFTINLSGVSANNADINLATVITWTGGSVGATYGNFIGATPGTVSGGSYTVGSGNLTFVIAGVGTFVGSGGVQVDLATTQFVAVLFNSPGTYGTFTPSGSLAGGPYAAGPAGLTFSFTQTGQAFSGSGTLATPPDFVIPPSTPPSVPEPSSLILLGTGLIGGVGAVRRRFKA